MKQYQFGLGNISKGFAANNMRPKLNPIEYMHDFFVKNETIDISDIVDIHKYLI